MSHQAQAQVQTQTQQGKEEQQSTDVREPPGIVAVIDINGVVADVRRWEAPRITDRTPDAVLPNRQKVYMHPSCSEFFAWLKSARIPVVMFTSRNTKNAEDIERWLRDNVEAYSPVLTMHGEDCGGLKYPLEPWRPMKSDSAVRTQLVRAGRTDLAGKTLVFVDDHPERIRTTGYSNYDCYDSVPIKVDTYDAMTVDDESAISNMRNTLWEIHDLLFPGER